MKKSRFTERKALYRVLRSLREDDLQKALSYVAYLRFVGEHDDEDITQLLEIPPKEKTAGQAAPVPSASDEEFDHNDFFMPVRSNFSKEALHSASANTARNEAEPQEERQPYTPVQEIREHEADEFSSPHKEEEPDVTSITAQGLYLTPPAETATEEAAPVLEREEPAPYEEEPATTTAESVPSEPETPAADEEEESVSSVIHEEVSVPNPAYEPETELEHVDVPEPEQPAMFSMEQEEPAAVSDVENVPEPEADHFEPEPEEKEPSYVPETSSFEPEPEEPSVTTEEPVAENIAEPDLEPVAETEPEPEEAPAANELPDHYEPVAETEPEPEEAPATDELTDHDEPVAESEPEPEEAPATDELPAHDEPVAESESEPEESPATDELPARYQPAVTEEPIAAPVHTTPVDDLLSRYDLLPENNEEPADEPVAEKTDEQSADKEPAVEQKKNEDEVKSDSDPYDIYKNRYYSPLQSQPKVVEEDPLVAATAFAYSYPADTPQEGKAAEKDTEATVKADDKPTAANKPAPKAKPAASTTADTDQRFDTDSFFMPIHSDLTPDKLRAKAKQQHTEAAASSTTAEADLSAPADDFFMPIRSERFNQLKDKKTPAPLNVDETPEAEQKKPEPPQEEPVKLAAKPQDESEPAKDADKKEEKEERPTPPASAAHLKRVLRSLHLTMSNLAWIFDVPMSLLCLWMQKVELNRDEDEMLQYLLDVADRVEAEKIDRFDLVVRSPLPSGESFMRKLKRQKVTGQDLKAMKDMAEEKDKLRHTKKGAGIPIYAFRDAVTLYATPLHSEVRKHVE